MNNPTIPTKETQGSNTEPERSYINYLQKYNDWQLLLDADENYAIGFVM